MKGTLLPPTRPNTIEIFLPLKPNRSGGRKYLIAPDGATVPANEKTEKASSMQCALGRGFYWRQEIESGKYDGTRDFAQQNKLGEDYVYRQTTLTLLAPSIIERILDNTLPRYVTLAKLYKLTMLELWEEQEKDIALEQKTLHER